MGLSCESRRSEPESAKAAGLNYVTDAKPGIHRRWRGREFHYFSPGGQRVVDKLHLARIKRLAIPPAWTTVWICPDPNGHLQATGRDARGRKQYRYHPHWREVRDETKYNRLLDFARHLPKIRARVERDLTRPGLSRERVLATVLKILETGLIRVGNDEYARTNKSFGLTTMRDRHALIKGRTIRFQFRGKSGKHHSIDIEDRRLAKIVAQCQAIPGQELFQYIDGDGTIRDITSTDVNSYLRDITQSDFTAKDFRTWGGTVLAAKALAQSASCKTKKEARKNLVRAIESVAQRLGNTPSVCRKCYIHPLVINSYLDGSFIDTFKKRADQQLKNRSADLSRDELMVLRFLRQGLDRQKRNRRSTLIDKLQASLKHRKSGQTKN